MQTSINVTLTIGATGDFIEVFDVPLTKATYFVGGLLLGNAVGAFLMEPFSRLYGRRPVYIFTFALVVATSVASAYCKTYAALMACRVLNGIGLASGVSIGATTVTDLFFQHQRGFVTGVWVCFTSNGSFVGSLIGEYIVYYQPWPWVFKAAAIINGATLLGFILTVPETAYNRRDELYTMAATDFKPYHFLDHDRFFVVRRRSTGPVRPFRLLLRCFEVAIRPSVLIPGLACAACIGTSFIVPTIIIPSFYAEAYGFSTRAAANINVAGIIGVLLGEAMAGRWSDFIVSTMAKRHGGVRVQEYRLHALWPCVVLIPAGLITFGTCIFYRVPWIGSCIGFCMAVAGTQIVVTITTAYSIDSYKPVSGYVGTVYTFFRQVNGFTIPFYAVPFGEGAGFAWEFGTLAIIVVVALSLTLAFIWIGAGLRHKYPAPATEEDKRE